MYGKGYNTVADNNIHIDDKEHHSWEEKADLLEKANQQEEERQSNFKLSTTESVQMLHVINVKSHQQLFPLLFPAMLDLQ